MPGRPVRPVDAAGLVLIRRGRQEPEVLLGRRHRRHAFLPNIYVFPGGRVDAADSIPSGFSETLRPDLVRHVAVGRRDPATLVRAAVRETFEESGALLAAGGPDRACPPADPSENVWQVYRRLALVPAFAAIALVGRAITPTSSPRRYNTHFFLADATPFPGTILGNGELEDLAWWPLGKVRNLGLVDVTEFMLGEALALWRAGLERPAGARPPLLTYVGDALRVRR